MPTRLESPGTHELPPHPGQGFRECDVLVDLPWLVVARLWFANGTLYEVTCNNACEDEDYALARSLRPDGSVCVGNVSELGLLPPCGMGCQGCERTFTYWQEAESYSPHLTIAPN